MAIRYVFDKDGTKKRVIVPYDDSQSFKMPTCTDDSKFIPDVSSTKQYNGNATGTSPQYDMDVYDSNGDLSMFNDVYRLATIRRDGLDIAEVDAISKSAEKRSKDAKQKVKESVDNIKESGFMDKTLSNNVN